MFQMLGIYAQLRCHFSEKKNTKLKTDGRLQRIPKFNLKNSCFIARSQQLHGLQEWVWFS